MQNEAEEQAPADNSFYLIRKNSRSTPTTHLHGVVNFASEVIAKAEYYNQNLPDNRSDNCRFDKATFLPEEKCCKCLFRYIDVQRSISNITNPLSPPLDSRTSHLRTSFFKLIFGFVFPVPVFSRVVSSRELVYCVA